MYIRPGIVYVQARNRDQKRETFAKSHEKPTKMQQSNQIGTHMLKSAT
jgi:hypothetical protein